MKKLSPTMLYLNSLLTPEEQENKLHYEKLISENKVSLSPSSMKVLVTDPLAFFKKYVCGNYDDKESKYQKQGTLIHSLMLDDKETFNDSYFIMPEGLKVPTDKAYSVLQNLLNNPDIVRSELSDIEDYVLAAMAAESYYQNLKTDTDRLNKMLTTDNCTYFRVMSQSKNKTVISNAEYLEAVNMAKLAMLAYPGFTPDESFQEAVCEIELSFLHQSSIAFKCIIDHLLLDTKRKKIVVTDVKKVSNTLTKILKWDIENNRYDIQAVINYLAVKEFKNMLRPQISNIDDYEIEYQFLFIDGIFTAKPVKISEATMNGYISRFETEIEENVKYHFETLDFSQPAEFLKKDVIL